MQILDLPAKQIKRATEKHHSQIEGVLGVMEPDFSKFEYIELLKKFYGFYVTIEEIIAENENLPTLGYSARRKTPLLLSDLKFFGVPGIENIPRLKPWFDSLSEAEVLGILYVIEGSTLGGQIISRHLAQHFSFERDMGSRFFASYGKDVGPMWMKFQALLNERLDNKVDLEMAMVAAGETFDQLGAWLRL